MLRTHTCGDITENLIGQEITLAGWIQKIRDLGGLLFLDVRDRYGLVQIVINPQKNPALADKARVISRESTVAITGIVQARPVNMVNKEMPSGRVEVVPSDIQLLSVCQELPIPLEETAKDVGEDLRLQYRFLELRRPAVQKGIITRHHCAMVTRKFLDSQGFLEIETPFLMKSTPEGARDFLVPSRINRGKFYALPQSPQTYKQILMVAGFDKYFQIVRCFRDEDLRADRQLEFTQIDIEMSFIREEDIFEVVEALMSEIFHQVAGVKLHTPFPRLSYEQALAEYGVDKPDIRFDLKFANISRIVENKGFGVFDKILASGGEVIAIPLPNSEISRKQGEEIQGFAKECGLAGVVIAKWSSEGLNAPLGKVFEVAVKDKLQKLLLSGKLGSVIIGAGEKETTLKALGRLRLKLVDYLQIPRREGFHPLWVAEFPLFELDEDGKLTSAHHPFTSPLPQDLPLMETEPLKVRSRAYDLVLNGYEIASGSIRIHNRELQERVFLALGIGPEEAQEKFGFLLKAFQYGPPPHGGIALGFDRLVMLICGKNSIREVIAFPKTTSGLSLMDGSPSLIPQEQLEELGIILK
jgi:aspartyl-tRNA synthetase